MTKIASGSGSSLSIGPTTPASTADAYAGLIYAKIGGGGTIGDFGPTAAQITFDGLEDEYTTKAKGIRNAGSIQVTCAYDADDAGQQAVIAAEATKFAYAFKAQAADAQSEGHTDSVWYFHALVQSAVVQIGGPNDVTRLAITLDITGGIVAVPSEAIGS